MITLFLPSKVCKHCWISGSASRCVSSSPCTRATFLTPCLPCSSCFPFLVPHHPLWLLSVPPLQGPVPRPFSPQSSPWSRLLGAAAAGSETNVPLTGHIHPQPGVWHFCFMFHPSHSVKFYEAIWLRSPWLTNATLSLPAKGGIHHVFSFSTGPASSLPLHMLDKDFLYAHFTMQWDRA